MDRRYCHIFQTWMFTVITKSFFSKYEEKKQTTISSLENLTFELELFYFLYRKRCFSLFPNIFSLKFWKITRTFTVVTFRNKWGAIHLFSFVSQMTQIFVFNWVSAKEALKNRGKLYKTQNKYSSLMYWHVHQKLLLYLMVQNMSILENKKRYFVWLHLYDYYTVHRNIESYSIILSVAILQVHTPDLKNKFCALHTDSGINAPQRKKEIERYGEREKLYICW